MTGQWFQRRPRKRRWAGAGFLFVLLLFPLVIIGWRSYRVGYSFVVDLSTRKIVVNLWNNEVIFIVRSRSPWELPASTRSTNLDPVFHWQPIAPGFVNIYYGPPPPIAWEVLGVRRYAAAQPWIAVNFGVSWYLSYFIAGGFALMCFSRARRRWPCGRCQRCGYDLRASKDRCPECGTPIPVLAVSN